MAPITMQVLSDLHLETHPSYSYNFKQTAPYLALLGDIGHIADDGLFTFLEAQVKRYWVVFFLLGNHEPIHLSWPVAKQRVREFERRLKALRNKSTIGKFVFLDQTRYDVNSSITVLGCTFFSNIQADQMTDVASRMVDFRQISDWKIQGHNDAHSSDLAWLNSQVEKIAADEPERQIIVFSHHCPTTDSRATVPAHANSTVSSGFMTNISNELCWKSTSVTDWAFGHTHCNCAFEDNLGKQVFCNQKGYFSKPEEDFEAKRIFSVGTPLNS